MYKHTTHAGTFVIKTTTIIIIITTTIIVISTPIIITNIIIIIYVHHGLTSVAVLVEGRWRWPGLGGSMASGLERKRTRLGRLGVCSRPGPSETCAMVVFTTTTDRCSLGTPHSSPAPIHDEVPLASAAISDLSLIHI